MFEAASYKSSTAGRGYGGILGEKMLLLDVMDSKFDPQVLQARCSNYMYVLS